MRKITRRGFLLAGGGAALALGIGGFPAIIRRRRETGAVIVLGIDGMDPELTCGLIARGELPNCQRLMGEGALMRLGTTNPPQSPVAWSSFASGTNPGGHGIFDFITRNPATMKPMFTMADVKPPAHFLAIGRHRIPVGARHIRNMRQGPTLWVELEKNGIDCTVLRIPANFPPTECRAKTLSGMGTPDIQGGYGTFTLFTDNPDEGRQSVPGGRIERIKFAGWHARRHLAGPENHFRAGTPQTLLPVDIFIDPANPVAKIVIQHKEILINEGEWSEWTPVRFRLVNGMASAAGICRFYLKKARNDFMLYASPVNIDPIDPALPISTPAGYAGDLAREIGRFYTQSMAEDTGALSAGVLNDDEYREQAMLVLEEQERLFEHSLSKFKGGFLFNYFSCLDLNSHAFWRALDPGHPLYTPELARRHGDFIPMLYRRMDKAIGRALEAAGSNAWVMAVSDHGFASFRRKFNLNSWLMDYGYAGSAGNVPREQTTYFNDTDWTNTKAYGLGLNGLFINLKGREMFGTIEPGDEAERVKRDLIRHLMAIHDPETGDRVIKHVFRPDEIYSGAYMGNAPDLLVSYNRNYRASWETALGGYPEKHLADNTDAWSGDHAMDAGVVPGILMSNRRIDGQSPAIWDMAGMIMRAFGLPIP